MYRTKVLVLRTLGGNRDNSNVRQMSHDRIWDVMNNGNFGVADYYRNNSKDYDIFDQIINYNHGQKPNWQFNDIAFIIGIYTKKYVRRASQATKDSNYNEDDLYPSILYPYSDTNTPFIKSMDRGVDIAFQFYKKIYSIRSVQLDDKLIEIKKSEFKDNSKISTFPALCFTLELQSFMNYFIK